MPDQPPERLGLSPRETEVAIHVASGLTDREIAAILCVSPRTVNKHLLNIFERLGLRNRVQLAAYVVALLAVVQS